jgi:hypothetical protein
MKLHDNAASAFATYMQGNTYKALQSRTPILIACTILF